MYKSQSTAACSLGKIEVNLEAKVKLLPLNWKINFCQQGYSF